MAPAAPFLRIHTHTQLPDDPSELQQLLMKTGAELRNAKLRVGKMKAEVRVRDERVGKMEAVVGKMEAEVRVRDERVGKMEAEVREREARLTLANAALASSNTELLRYKRKCVPVYGWADRPTVSPLASPRPLRLPVHVHIPTFPLQTS